MQKTLVLNPKFTQADILISQSMKFEKNDPHHLSMNEKIQLNNLTDQQEINLHFAIAKAEEDIGNIKKSFKHLEQGNSMKRQSINFNIKNEIQLFSNIKKIFYNHSYIKEIKKDGFNKNIIFILGMPRSGTSLIEQIITSHSNVFGAGELPQLSKIIQNNLLSENEISKLKFENFLNNKDNITNTMRKNYFNYLNRFNFNEDFITDKAPLNFRWIGLIRILFPKSKIIHCTRDAKDNCLSLYKNLFEGGLNFSYNQKELGTYYNLYFDLMNFWEKQLGNFIYEAKYEKIITNQEDETKKIIEFCNLPWEENCLSFHKNETPIKTMSTAQARRPIYKSSIKSHEKFSEFLDVLNKTI